MPSRAAKEIRTLLLPAGLVLAATVVSALLASHPSVQVYQVAVSIGMSAFILGTPLLAAWSFGAEFHQRTFVLLLSQPIARSRIWMEKWLTLLLVAGLVVALQSALLPFDEDLTVRARVAWFAAMLLATPLWTLVARSTIGGLAFSGGVVALLEMAAAIVLYWIEPGTRIEMFRETPVLNALRVLYAIAAFAAGWWWFSRAEAGRFDPASSSRHLSKRLAVPFLAYRRAGALRNLLVTEMHLHRITWLLAAAWTVCWLGAVAILAGSGASTGTVETTFSILLAVYFPLGVVLAGTLSVSEDATLGVHGWRLTFPLAARAQWLVKLAAALLVAVIVVVALPMAMVQVLTLVFWPERGPAPVVQPQAFVLVVGLVVVCFWAATVFGHTVRAAVAAGAVLVACVTSVSLVMRLSYPAWMFEVLEAGMTWSMVRWQLPPDFFAKTVDPGFMVVVPLAVSVVGLPLSLHAFRRVRIGRTATAAHIATMFAVMLVTAVATLVFAEAAWRQNLSTPVEELRLAVVEATTRTPAGLAELTVEDLRRTGRLSSRAERWLAGSRITVEIRPDSARSVRVRFPGEREYVSWARPVRP